MSSIKEKINVGIADLAVIHNPAVLVTVGLGSCVAISFRDPVAKFGALAHIVLPGIEQSRNRENPLKFADSAIDIAIKKLLEKGCSKNRIESKIAGGACMFNFGGTSFNIGERNVEAVRKKLGEMNIPILAGDTGGNHGRTVEFDVETGVMSIKSAVLGIKKI
ncbi:Chemoreceptor glutamine deamidase CheD [uncultured archaeon]|nr:Chemoreceptor glutamine deamidase CheD [uncultured archaeon]